MAPRFDLPGEWGLGMGASRQWRHGPGDRSDDIKVLFGDNYSLVRLRGELDVEDGEALAQVGDLAIEYGHPVLVDVSELTFMDSTGLAFLARLAAAGVAAGWRPVVMGTSDRVQEVIELGGLLPVVDLSDKT
jgi:anti-anti-sigma factor